MSTVYFSSQTSSRSPASGEISYVNRVWATDGTAAGTRLVWSGSGKDRSDDTPHSVSDFLAYGNGIIFRNDNDLYASDGTAAGTHLISSVAEGTTFTSNGAVYFGAEDDPNIADYRDLFGLYRWDGTTVTAMKNDIFSASGYRSLSDFVSSDTKFFFVANFRGGNGFGGSNGVYGGQLFTSDGTAAGTFALKGLSSTTLYVPDALAVLHGDVYFGVNDSSFANKPQLWKSDGTPAGTKLVANLAAGTATDASPSHLTSTGDELFFTANKNTELWKSDGTASGTSKVVDASIAARPENLINNNGTLYFSASDASHGGELWQSDGTSAGTHIVKDINPGAGSSSIGDLLEINGILYFSATDGAHGSQLWRSDGTEAGTFALINRSPANLLNVGGILYFEGNDGNSQGLYRTDGTAAGTVEIASGVDVTSGLVTTDVAGGLGWSPGNDRLIALSGNHVVDGGAGLDTIVYSFEHAQVKITKQSGDNIQIAKPDGTSDTLLSIERLEFHDGTLAFDSGGNAGSAYRLYQAAFNRAPDNAGLGFWIKQLDAGKGDLAWVAANFISSQEFKSTYGDPSNVTDSAFVNLLYQNVLHRAPDQAGQNYWTSEFNHGSTREEVLRSFAESTENQHNVADAISDGIWFT